MAADTAAFKLFVSMDDGVEVDIIRLVVSAWLSGGPRACCQKSVFILNMVRLLACCCTSVVIWCVVDGWSAMRLYGMVDRRSKASALILTDWSSQRLTKFSTSF